MKTNFIRAFFQVVKQISLFAAGIIILYFLTALMLSFLSTHPADLNCHPSNQIYVSSNGVHLDIIVPVELINVQLLNQLEGPVSITHISFGWGDKQFYQKTPEWSDLTFPVAFQALFLKGESAMHVNWYSRSYLDWKSIILCTEQIEILNQYIDNSFKKDVNGNVVKCSFPGYSGLDFFYDANGSFSVFQTCNVWVNHALKTINVETSVWSPFDFGILHHINKTNPSEKQKSSFAIL